MPKGVVFTTAVNPGNLGNPGNPGNLGNHGNPGNHGNLEIKKMCVFTSTNNNVEKWLSANMKI